MNNNILDKNNVENIYSLTKMQESMFFTYIQNSNTLEYFEQLTIKIEGLLDIDVLKTSIEMCTEKNEALRTVFRWKNISNPIQIVLKHKSIDFDFVKLAEESDKKQQLKDYCIRDKSIPIDLEISPIRFAVCTDEKNFHALVITNHHMLYDGWSTGILLKEIFTNYLNLKNGKASEFMPKMKIQKYIEWLNSDKSSEKQFWNNYFSGIQTITGIPSSQNGNTVRDMRDYTSIISEEQLNKLYAFSSQYNISLASVL